MFVQRGRQLEVVQCSVPLQALVQKSTAMRAVSAGYTSQETQLKQTKLFALMSNAMVQSSETRTAP